MVVNPGGGGNKKIRDQPHALEPTLSKELELGPESVGGLKRRECRPPAAR